MLNLRQNLAAILLRRARLVLLRRQFLAFARFDRTLSGSRAGSRDRGDATKWRWCLDETSNQHGEGVIMVASPAVVTEEVKSLVAMEASPALPGSPVFVGVTSH